MDVAFFCYKRPFAIRDRFGKSRMFRDQHDLGESETVMGLRGSSRECEDDCRRIESKYPDSFYGVFGND